LLIVTLIMIPLLDVFNQAPDAGTAGHVEGAGS
jgi:hypothetical protein